MTLETDQLHGERPAGRLAPVPSVESLEHELKFVLPVSAAPVLRVWLGGVCRPDPGFPHGIVSSIYYDTRDWRLLAEKINSDYLKTKIRVRWYSMPGRADVGGPAFLEAKFRVGGRREKIRLALAETGQELLERGFDDPVLASLPRRLRARGLSVDESLVPAMVIRYERRRWIEPGAGARVSLDTNISSPMASAVMGLHVKSPLHVAVVEAKGHFDRLPASLQTITALGGRRASFSKYWACYQHGRRIAL